MTTFAQVTPWALASLWAIPALGALFATRAADPIHARRRAVGAQLLTLALACGVGAAPWWTADGVLRGPWEAYWAVDELSGPLLPFIGWLVLAVLLAAPSRVLGPRALFALLLSQALILLAFSTSHPAVLATSLVASCLPGLRLAQHELAGDPEERRRVVRVYAVFVLGGTLTLAAALAAMAGTSGLQVMPTYGAAPTPVAAEAAPHALLVLLWIGVLVRMGLLPFHSWIPVLFERGPVAITSLLLAAQPSAYVVARLGPLLLSEGERIPHGLELLADLSLATALYGALLGLAQTDLRRWVGCLALSTNGLILVGLGSGALAGIGGALTLWMSLGLSITGIALIGSALRSRFGTDDAEKLGGVAHRAPHMAAAFLTFGLAAVGLPGSLGFIGEDMLVHGVLEEYPAVGSLIMVVTALNGVSLFRIFVRAFLGRLRRPGWLAVDLLPRERWGVALLLLVLFGFGVFPAPITRAREHAVQGLLRDTAAGDFPEQPPAARDAARHQRQPPLAGSAPRPAAARTM